MTIHPRPAEEIVVAHHGCLKETCRLFQGVGFLCTKGRIVRVAVKAQSQKLRAISKKIGDTITNLECFDTITPMRIRQHVGQTRNKQAVCPPLATQALQLSDHRASAH